MYQEETYETNDDDAREAAQLADELARFDYEAALQQQTLWAGTKAMDYRGFAAGMARDLAKAVKEVA